MFRSIKLPILLAFAGLVACSSTPKESTPYGIETIAAGQGWLDPTPDLIVQMEQRMEQMPWVHGVEGQVEMIQWWADKGELAYSRLLLMAGDTRPQVSDLALAALATTRDGRLVEPLRMIPWPAADQQDLMYSRARTHLRLGDWKYVSVLVDGLEDERLFARAMCFKTLRGATKLDHGFVPKAAMEARAPAVGRWREWVSARSGDLLLK
ncbi:MAG: hypothetical protein ACI8QC_001430 [Planctomycetota bacterium]|jgi:hypothetical protein